MHRKKSAASLRRSSCRPEAAKSVDGMGISTWTVTRQCFVLDGLREELAVLIWTKQVIPNFGQHLPEEDELTSGEAWRQSKIRTRSSSRRRRSSSVLSIVIRFVAFTTTTPPALFRVRPYLYTNDMSDSQLIVQRALDLHIYLPPADLGVLLLQAI